MKKLFKYFLFASTFCLQTLFGQTFDVQFNTSINNGTNLQLEVQVRLNTPPAPLANTLNSVSFDVIYSDALAAVPGLLTYTGPTDWFFTAVPQGYATTMAARVGDNKLRITIIGNLVGLGGTFVGYDLLNNTFETWVKLNFTHTTPAGSAEFYIDPAVASISLFNVAGNAGNTGANTTYVVPSLSLAGLNVNPLPVELSSFAGKMYDQDKVKLNWETKTEVNNYGFDVERQATNGQWEKVGFVNGNGNSNSPKEYSYIDKNLIGGNKFLYRLKQVDNDGQFEYSDIVEVGFIPNKFELYQNYPNPFNPETKIRYQLPNASKVVIKIYNTLGAEVMELVNEQKEAGIYEAELNASNLSSGTYIYKINADNFVQTKKMVLLK